jgi:hypothetical protein
MAAFCATESLNLPPLDTSPQGTMPGRAGLKQFVSTHRNGWMFLYANGTLLNSSIAAGARPDFAGQPVGGVAQVGVCVGAVQGGAMA